MENNTDIIYSRILDRYIEIIYSSLLYSIRFIQPEKRFTEIKKHPVTHQLERYFNGEHIIFSCNIDISNLTLFERKVLEEVRNIKYGETLTYSELAEKIGSRAIRAVGNALSKNPVPIVIPCHRIVGKNTIGGYSAGIEIKTRLLELEKMNLNNL